ncbi:hypothetical protein [Actinomyces faecalis]|uniref:hypothetical protein n=1 Tax=Actinomyces faecalis TaxID=2722820 RepID=UPI0015522285|nr:hypothetical protein [Actinomyces faecalis]
MSARGRAAGRGRRPGPVRWVLARVPRVLSPSQAVVRGVSVLVLLGAAAVAGTFPLLMAVLAVVALWTAVAPEEGSLLSLAVMVLAWFFGDRDVSSWTTVLVALALVTDHTCLVLASSAPPRARLPWSVVRRAALRGLVVAGATTAVWAGLAVLPRGSVPPAAVVAALAVLAAGAWTAGRQPGSARS